MNATAHPPARAGRWGTTLRIAQSTRAELLRLRKWPAIWVTLGIWIALALTFGYLFPYLSYRTGDVELPGGEATRVELMREMLPPSVPDVLVQGMPMFGAALAMVLGGIIAGSGYGWGTWKTLYAQGLGRTVTLAGSLIATTVLIVGTVLATTGAFAVTSVGVAAAENQAMTAPGAADLAQAALTGVLVLEMWALLGYALGTIARSPALAVGLGLVWSLVVENLLRGVGAVLAPVDSATSAMPGTAGGSLIGAVLDNGPNETPGVLYVLTGEQATATAIGYVTLAVVLAWTLVNRRDVA